MKTFKYALRLVAEVVGCAVIGVGMYFLFEAMAFGLLRYLVGHVHPSTVDGLTDLANAIAVGFGMIWMVIILATPPVATWFPVRTPAPHTDSLSDY